MSAPGEESVAMGLERYEIKDTISRSTRTLVRRARRVQDGVPVVIKSLLRDYPAAHEIAQLEFEYRILRKLDAPGIPRALDLVRDGNKPAIVLEDFGGQSLPSCAEGAAGLDLFFTIALAVAKTLGAVHGRGVIHKDVKPRNVLMNPATREIKLIDFNSATELSREHQDLSVPSRLEGSLAYVSPEQTGRMNREVDYRSDYYSLGVTFFELLTGTLPFSAADTMGWVHCHLSKPAPDPRSVSPSIPEPLARVVVKLMAKNPDDRYQSARGLIKDLERCRDGWAKKGAVEPFALGTDDVSERFQVSQRLLGREREVSTLLEAFEATSQGSARLLLVGGYSGVGKSSLIHEIQGAIVRARGHFVAGKFGQLERNVPYGALLQSIRGLVKHLLAEPEDRLEAYRQRLVASLGQYGKVLVDLIPELEQIVGRPPPVPDVGAHDARLRLQRAFRELVRAIARPEHPLVIFIDDLQWTDASTPELLVNLLGDEALRHVLVIGAYRDNEVGEGHLLSLALKELEAQRPGAVIRILLSPLSEDSVQRLVAHTLCSDIDRSAPLGALVFQKTGGNPFFVNELLRMLHRDGAFRFLAEEGRWDWDHDRIRKVAVSDNVVDLMVGRLRRLAGGTLEHLCLAACLGNQFDLMTLARVAERPAGSIAAALWEAVEQGVVVPLGNGYRLVEEGAEYDDDALSALGVEYRFQHDRVRQAAYLLLGEDERARVHLCIGRLLRARAQAPERDTGVFDLVNHLNLGRGLIAGYEERAELARLNQLAGQRAKRAAAYAIALTYFETSLGLLSSAEWARHPDPELRFECCRIHAECVFLTGAIERAATLADELLELAPTKVARGRAVELKVTLLEHQGRLHEAVDTIRRSLVAFGVDLPADHGEIDRRIGEGIAKMQAHLARVPVEDLVRLPELEDRELCMAMNLLFQVIPSAIQTYPPLFILTELVMFDLALVHGATAVSCKNFVDCGIIQGGILGDYDTAYRLGKVAFAMLDRYAPTPLESGVHFVFGAFVSHWRAPVREGFEAFAQAARAGLELGDLRHAAATPVHVLQRMLLAGRTLDDCRAEGLRAISYLQELHATNNLAGARAAQRVVARLCGASEISHPTDAFTAGLVELGNVQWLFSYGQAETLASFVLGDLESARVWQAFTERFVAAGTGLLAIPDYHLFDALIAAQQWSTESEAGRKDILARLVACQEKLRIWAESSGANFTHKYKLCSAEIARLRGAPIDEALALYDDAIASAGAEFVHMQALANELLARYWSEKRQRKIARTFLEEAYYLYERWGAHAKLRELERQHPEWLGQLAQPGGRARTTTTTVSRDSDGSGSLDLESITKATRAISSEVRADRLFAKLMSILIENAGAQRGCLILKGAGGDLTVEARARVEGDRAEDTGRMPIEQCMELCPDIVRYVARTADTIVVDDATLHVAYRDDQYIRQNGVKSVLCIPVLNQGKLVAILYAENNAATHAFTSQRLSLLQVIASHAAISIANARLYESLEEKVTERTRELAEKNREIEAMLNSMQQGIFTIGEDLRVEKQYSAHLELIVGSQDIANRDCLEVVFQGSSVGLGALDAMRCALSFAFGVPRFIAEVNVPHLVQEFHRANARGETRYFEVDWDLITGDDDRVYKILTTLRDVTLVRQLKESVAAKARELETVGQILDAGVDAFQRFCGSARSLLHEIGAILETDAPITRDALGLMFRNMHTLKGDARLLGLGELVDTVHEAEGPYTELRSNPALAADRQRLRAGLDRVLDAIAGYEDVYLRKLAEVTQGGPSARLGQVLEQIDAVVKEVAGGGLVPAQAIRSVERALRSAEAVPLRELVKESARMLPSLAREHGKLPPALECEDRGVLLTPAWAQVMRDVLVHAFRNALDHGLETPDEREQLGKPPQGHVAVCVDRADGGVAIRVSDDGHGLRLSALRERARAVDATDEEVASTIFVSGISTATALSTTSGRGVGMEAIRSFLRRQGGDVRIVFTGEPHEGSRPFELVFELPESALAGAPDDKVPPVLSAAV
jgi:predicted ATPase/GAF domain-containing protein